jgi:hypothetical protein
LAADAFRCYLWDMRRAQVIDRLKSHQSELAALGVDRLSLFGSVARDTAGGSSDVDVVVDSPDGQPLGLFRLARVADALEHILGRRVDVISRAGLEHTKTLKGAIAPDLLDVF